MVFLYYVSYIQPHASCFCTAIVILLNAYLKKVKPSCGKTVTSMDGLF